MHNYIAKGIALAVAIAASGTVQAIEKESRSLFFRGQDFCPKGGRRK